MEILNDIGSLKIPYIKKMFDDFITIKSSNHNIVLTNQNSDKKFVMINVDSVNSLAIICKNCKFMRINIKESIKNLFLIGIIEKIEVIGNVQKMISMNEYNIYIHEALNKTSYSLKYINPTQCVKKIVLSQYNKSVTLKTIHKFADIEELVIDACNLKFKTPIDFSIFEKIKRISIIEKYSQKIIGKLPKSLEHLKLLSDDVYFNGLEDVKYMEIIYCEKLTNCDSFPKVEKLRLFNCVNFINCSAIDYIEIDCCSYFKDVAPLANSKSVKLIWCPKITSIEPLKNVPYLSIINCPNITDFHTLGNHFEIELKKNGDIDLSPFINVPVIKLDKEDNLDTSKLTGIIKKI